MRWLLPFAGITALVVGGLCARIISPILWPAISIAVALITTVLAFVIDGACRSGPQARRADGLMELWIRAYGLKFGFTGWFLALPWVPALAKWEAVSRTSGLQRVDASF